MASYQQYCPVARATEILGERWSLLVVRNLLFGASTFNDIAAGVPRMSRSMLVKRLRSLEAHGVVAAAPKPDGHGRTYALTPAGRDLLGVVEALGSWATRWVDVLPEHADPGFALWAWTHVQLDRDALPVGRVVVAITFPDEAPGDRHYWLLVANGDAEVCTTDPGDEPAATVVARSQAFVDWHRGALDWVAALRRGDIAIEGRRDVVRSFPRWNLRRPVLPARAGAVAVAGATRAGGRDPQ